MKILDSIGKDTLKGAALHVLAAVAGELHTVTAGEVTAGEVVKTYPTAPRLVIAEVYSTLGVKKTWDGAVTVTGNAATIDNSGATDFVAGDLILTRAYFE